MYGTRRVDRSRVNSAASDRDVPHHRAHQVAAPCGGGNPFERVTHKRMPCGIQIPDAELRIGSDGTHGSREQRDDRPTAAIVLAGFRSLHDGRIDTAADRLACLSQRADLLHTPMPASCRRRRERLRRSFQKKLTTGNRSSLQTSSCAYSPAYSTGSAAGRGPSGKVWSIPASSSSVSWKSPARVFAAACSGRIALGIVKSDCRRTRRTYSKPRAFPYSQDCG